MGRFTMEQGTLCYGCEEDLEQKIIELRVDIYSLNHWMVRE